MLHLGKATPDVGCTSLALEMMLQRVTHHGFDGQFLIKLLQSKAVIISTTRKKPEGVAVFKCSGACYVLQDEMNEIREREAEGEAAGKAAAEWKAHAARLQEANLDVRLSPPAPWPSCASFAICPSASS